MTSQPNSYILVTINDLSLDRRADALQVSSGTGIESVFAYHHDKQHKFVKLFFHTNEVVVRFDTDSYWNRRRGFNLTLSETNGDGKSKQVWYDNSKINIDLYPRISSTGLFNYHWRYSW